MWKKHVLLGCSAQSPQATKSTAKIIMRAMTMKDMRFFDV